MNDEDLTEHDLVLQFLDQCEEVKETLDKLQELSEDYVNDEAAKIVGDWDMFVLTNYRERYETQLNEK